MYRRFLGSKARTLALCALLLALAATATGGPLRSLRRGSSVDGPDGPGCTVVDKDGTVSSGGTTLFQAGPWARFYQRADDEVALRLDGRGPGGSDTAARSLTAQPKLCSFAACAWRGE